ncbi:hypothetical protein [Phaeacidiphilus oryzae]|uniref:hypothetical protein n=1 Tax=Phaeacidiphilus oryzae TaxID=348818 RepID=UPI0007C7004F|nr:hypothetical protein [Phaeacidiphilus oryzae]
MAGYAGVRLFGLVVLWLWARRRGTTAYHRLTDWDTGWYLRVAERGYDHALVVHRHTGHVVPSDLAFFPLYPALLRAVHEVSPLTLVQSALLVTEVCALLAAWGIHHVAARLHGGRAAVLAAVLWGCWPVAIVENMAYSESVMTACAAWALYAVLTGRWLWAGVLASLAGLSRPSGGSAAAGVVAGALAALGLLLWRGWTGRRPAGRWAGLVPGVPAAGRGWWRPALGAVLAPLGWLGYIVWVGRRIGRPDGYFVVQRAWHSTFDYGASTWRQIAGVFANGDGHPTAVLLVAAVLIGGVALLLISAVTLQPLPLPVYSLALLVISLGDSEYFVSRARFLLPAFPLLLPIAVAVARLRSGAVRAIVLSSAAVLSAFLGGYLLLVWVHAP